MPGYVRSMPFSVSIVQHGIYLGFRRDVNRDVMDFPLSVVPPVLTTQQTSRLHQPESGSLTGQAIWDVNCGIKVSA